MITIIDKKISLFKFWGDKIVAIKGYFSPRTTTLVGGSLIGIKGNEELDICDEILHCFSCDGYIYIYDLSTSKMKQVIKNIYNYRPIPGGFYFTYNKEYKDFKFHNLKDDTISDTSAPMAYYMYKNASIHYKKIENKYTEILEYRNNWSYKIMYPDGVSEFIGVFEGTVFVLSKESRIIRLDIMTGEELFNIQVEKSYKEGIIPRFEYSLNRAKFDTLNKKIIVPYIQVDMKGNIEYSNAFLDYMPYLRDNKVSINLSNLPAFQFTDEIMVFSINKRIYTDDVDAIGVPIRDTQEGIYLYVLNRKDDSLIKRIKLPDEEDIDGIRQIIIRKDAIYASSRSGTLLKIDFDINDYDLTI